jgi:4-hydroxythreonine-4-phosphate dehydrogenase
MVTVPRIAMTLGDPSGIGPEIAVKVLSNQDNLQRAEVHLLASPAEINALCEEFGVTVPLSDEPKPGCVVAEGSDLAKQQVARGVCSLAGGQRAFSDLLHALALYKDGRVDSILFMSLNKTALHMAGMHEEDELRWFAKELNYSGFTSELNFIPGLATSRVTSHCGIKDVAPRISARGTREAINLLDRVLKGTGAENPRIAVCALNPHGGENGQFGREEIDHIAPGIDLARFDGVSVDGPFPPDTTFLRARKGLYDGVVTMYHDQGQIALKTIGFDEGVTVQGGLPVPICTPAHGTAYEIVGKGIASTGPAQRAFDIACKLGSVNL